MGALVRLAAYLAPKAADLLKEGVKQVKEAWEEISEEMDIETPFP